MQWRVELSTEYIVFSSMYEWIIDKTIYKPVQKESITYYQCVQLVLCLWNFEKAENSERESSKSKQEQMDESNSCSNISLLVRGRL